MNEEKRKILQMVQEARISAEDGAKLLSALDRPSQGQRTQTVLKSREGERSGKSLHIRVTDTSTGQVDAKFSIPLGVARIARSFMPEAELHKLDLHGVDLTQILEAVESGEVGTLFQLDDERHHRNVEAWIE